MCAVHAIDQQGGDLIKTELRHKKVKLSELRKGSIGEKTGRYLKSN